MAGPLADDVVPSRGPLREGRSSLSTSIEHFRFEAAPFAPDELALQRERSAAKTR